MKKSFKGFLACLLALIMVIPMFTVANADQMSTFNGTLQARETASVDVSRIRNSGIDMTADVAVKEQRNPEDIVTILVELEAAPAAEVCEDLKAAGDYREQLNASHKTAAAMINEKLGTEIVIKHNYSVVFNGFAFEGEYRLIDEINKLDGVRAFVDMEWESPNLFNTTTQVGAVDAWALDYSGEGTVVAILDTGCKVDHPAFSVEPSNVKFTRDNIASIIASGELQGSGSQMNVNSVYVSGKIPFRWNYYGNNADVSHKPSSSDHGTHVSGIAAGNGGEIRGVAKDAQLAAMQVFAPTGGASWSTIILAVEDCAVLGVDSANLSLGSPCGQESYYDASYAEVFERVTALGVNFAMAAGNDYDASMNNAWGSSDITTGTWGMDGYNLVSNPDYGVVGSPSTWPASLSVASVKNSKTQGYYISVEGVNYGYTENADNPVKMRQALGGQTVEYVMVPGFGTVEDFAQVNVQGKIALVQRGEINFTDKAANAEAAGAVACVVYNNKDDAVNMVAYEGGHIPHVFISKEAGEALAAASDKHAFVGSEMGISDSVGGNMPSDFSSRGVTATFGIKPEITAPGGQIYSATDPSISGALYQAWDGTSMATPHVAGGMAIVTQYVEDNFPGLSTRERQAMVDRILMSTATPVIEAGGTYAAVMDQGAGEMNLAKAVTTKAYLTAEGTYSNRPKLELGDDPEKTGVYTLTFTVHNFGTTALNYTIDPSVLLEDIGLLGYMDEAQELPIIIYTGESWDIAAEGDEVLLGDVNGNGTVEIADAVKIARHALELESYDETVCDINGNGVVEIADALLAMGVAMELAEPTYTSAGYVRVDKPDVVTVPAGGETEVTVTLNLTDNCKEYLDEYYTSGAIVNGFIELMPVSEADGVSLTIPFLTYYGDWNYAATVDRGYYYEQYPFNSNNYANTVGFKKGSQRLQQLGEIPFFSKEDDKPALYEYYLADRNAISPNGDGLLDTINLMYMGLLRNAEVRYVVLDTNGNELGVIADYGVCTKGFWDTDTRDQLGVTYGQFPGNYNFSQYNRSDLIVRIEAKLDNNGMHTTNAFSEAASENWKWDIPLHIDTQAPSVSNFSAANGKFTFNVTDEHYVAYVGVFTNNDGNLGDCQGEIAVMETQRGATTAIELSGEANNFVVTYDYAGNIAVYLWNGSTLSPVQVDPNPQPVGNYSDGYIYAYGLNLTDKRWLFFESNAPMTAVYEGEEAPNGESIAAAGYDANNGVVYALENSGKLYRYSGINPQSGKLTGRTQVATVAGADSINEMAFNNADGQLYAISGAANLMTVDVNTGAVTEIGQFGSGVVAMDFDSNGTLWIVDLYGALCSVNLNTGAITQVAETGISALAGQNFYSQSGCLFENTFYWAAIPGAGANAKTLVRFDVTNGAFEELGKIADGTNGLQTTGMFAIPMGNASIAADKLNNVSIAD